MLQMVAANMGISVVPAWLVSSLAMQSLLTVKKLGEQGIYKCLYARYEQNRELAAAIDQLIPQAKRAFSLLCY
jgi:LysR family transcriptional regulator for metE and metH